MKGLLHVALVSALSAGGSAAIAGETPLLLRAQNFLVPPSTGPVTHVVVKSRLDTVYTGTLRVQFPKGWQVTPGQHELELQPGETRRFAFTIERATNSADNSYPVRIRVAGSGGIATADQTVVCASAPYYKPTVDGDLDEWRDAIPIAFATDGKETTVRTYWNKRQFCLAVEVEETELVGLDNASAETSMDAIQFAVAPAPKGFGQTSDRRCEFLVAHGGAAPLDGRCFLLHKPGQEAALAREPRPLQRLELKEATVVVKRVGEVTRYEVAVPFKLVRALRPTPGREFRFSLLVHDPDGTGIRDLGEVMNLWQEHRQPEAWCSWQHVRWGDTIPYGTNIEFGLCSSVH